MRSPLVFRLLAVLDEVESWGQRVYLITPCLALRRCEAFRFVERPTHPDFDNGSYVGTNVEVFVETFSPIAPCHLPYLDALRELADMSVVCIYEPRRLPDPLPSHLLTTRDYRHPGRIRDASGPRRRTPTASASIGIETSKPLSPMVMSQAAKKTALFRAIISNEIPSVNGGFSWSEANSRI